MQAFEEAYQQRLKKKEQIQVGLNTSLTTNQSTFSSVSLFNKQKWNRNLELTSLDQLATYSNKQLQVFCYGIYSDNALTYTMRMEDSEKFQYLLARGVLPSATDSSGCNAIHYAIRMEKLNFLSYMLEGDFNAYERDDQLKLHITATNMSFTKSYM